jgi:hypothetical protein
MYIQNKPAARQIQPIGFSGRLEAIRAPTRGKARKGKKINRLLKGPAVPQSLEGCVAGPMYKDETVSTAPAKNMATERAASDHVSQEAARTLLPPPPCPCCLVSVVTTPLSMIPVSRTLRRALRAKRLPSYLRISPQGDLQARTFVGRRWRRYSPVSGR